MISLPWYLLAAGIGIVILGGILASLPASSGRGRRGIDAEMDDNEIADELRRARRIPIPNLIILVGFACILVSIVWRLARRFL